MPASLLLLLLLAGSSYTYGWMLAGNPVLPVFNAVFHSPYYPPANFHDEHWNAGFHWNIVWNLVFHTSNYVEGGAGTAGFVLIALGGSLLAALFDRHAAPLALVALGSFLLPLTQIQYLRYTHQALVLMIPAMMCGMPALARGSRHLHWVAGVLVALVVANLAFVSAADWQLGRGELGRYLTEPRQDFMAHYAPFGLLTPAAWVAMHAQRYMSTYGVTNEDFGRIAVVDRKHAATNPDAWFYQRPITLEDHQNSRWIVEPVLRLLDCCQESDGGVALIITSAERARDLRQPPAIITAAAQGAAHNGEMMTSYYRDEITGLPEMGVVARQLWRDSGLKPQDIQTAFIYDHFTPFVFAQLEELGFCGRGEAKDFATIERLSVKAFSDRWGEEEIAMLGDLLGRLTAPEQGELA